MKKITNRIASIITIFFILMTMTNCTVNADTANRQISTQIESENNLKKGEEIKLKISISKNEKGILGLQGTLNYDKDVFEIVNKNVVKENWNLSAFNEENGMFMIEISDDAFNDKNAYIYDTETILEVTLKAKEETKVIKSNIEINDVKAVDSDFQTINIEKASKNIKIKGNGLSTKTIIIIICVVIVLGLIIIFTKSKKKK